MRRPVGVIFAAVVLGLIAVLGATIGGLALGTLLFVHRPLIPRLPGVELTVSLIFGFSLFCLWAAVDLGRMRRWTRPAMVAIGAIDFVFSGLTGAAILWARQFAALLPPAYAADAQAGVVGAAVICFLIALAGIWWILYFSRSRVKAAFREAELSQHVIVGGNRVGS